MYGEDERSIYEYKCGKIKAEGGFVRSVTVHKCNVYAAIYGSKKCTHLCQNLFILTIGSDMFRQAIRPSSEVKTQRWDTLTFRRRASSI